MAQPSSRAELKDYALRRLGHPVLEVNVDDEQVEDLIDDALQHFHERHFDGIERMFLKHKITADDVERFKGSDQLKIIAGDEGAVTFTLTSGGTGYTNDTAVATTGGSGTGLTFDTTTDGGVIKSILINTDGQDYVVGDTITITGGNTDATIEVKSVDSDTTWENRNNYLTVPNHVVGISKVFGVSSNWVRNDLFGLSNQYFLMDIFSFSSGFAFGNFDMTNYYMIRQYFETLDMVVNTGMLVEYRWNQRQDKLFLDIDPSKVVEGNYLLIDCYRALDPTEYTQVYNDRWLKKYIPALIKRQWGQNLIKFQGVQLPGGVSLNGEKIFSDAEKEIAMILAEGKDQFELPAMDMIG